MGKMCNKEVVWIRFRVIGVSPFGDSCQLFRVSFRERTSLFIFLLQIFFFILLV